MIKTLIFDFGDVFIDLDKPATERELKTLGIDRLTSDMIAIAEQYEIGAIATETFVNHFVNLFPHTTSQQLIDAWNAIILNIPDYRLEFIEHMAETNTYNLILLSNTNALHIDKVIQNVGSARYEQFKSCFHKFYLSHEIGYRKPNADIFEFVLKENNLQAEDTLFIDDTLEHTVTAGHLGIKTWHLIPGEDDIINLFETQKKYF